MTNDNIERMKKIIEDKKKTSPHQSFTDKAQNKKIGNNGKAFKNTKRGGALDK